MKEIMEVLREFEAHGGKGIVYGGCLRDTLTGVGPIKDIDIAVQNTETNKAAIEKFFEERHKDNLWVIKNEQEIGYGNFPDVHKSIQIENFRSNDTPVNFVIMNDIVPFTVKDVAERCDFGICQIARDVDSVYWSPEFIHDLRRHTFTYTRSPFDEAQFNRSLRRFERFTDQLTGKYYGWTLRVPEVPHMGTYSEAVVVEIEDTI